MCLDFASFKSFDTFCDLFVIETFILQNIKVFRAWST